MWICLRLCRSLNFLLKWNLLILIRYSSNLCRKCKKKSYLKTALKELFGGFLYVIENARIKKKGTLSEKSYVAQSFWVVCQSLLSFKAVFIKAAVKTVRMTTDRNCLIVHEPWAVLVWDTRWMGSSTDFLSNLSPLIKIKVK